MKAFLILVLLFVTSCGSLKLSPKGCRTQGLWGDVGSPEVAFREVYYVWNIDHEVRLKDFLKAHQLDCSEIKKMRVEMKSVFFVRRELTIFVQK